jgi:hypothetical protein
MGREQLVCRCSVGRAYPLALLDDLCDKTSRQPSASGVELRWRAEPHPRRSRRWRAKTRPSTGRAGRPCTSCGRGHGRRDMRLRGPCTAPTPVALLGAPPVRFAGRAATARGCLPCSAATLPRELSMKRRGLARSSKGDCGRTVQSNSLPEALVYH